MITETNEFDEISNSKLKVAKEKNKKGKKNEKNFTRNLQDAINFTNTIRNSNFIDNKNLKKISKEKSENYFML